MDAEILLETANRSPPPRVPGRSARNMVLFFSQKLSVGLRKVSWRAMMCASEKYLCCSRMRLFLILRQFHCITENAIL